MTAFILSQAPPPAFALCQHPDKVAFILSRPPVPAFALYAGNIGPITWRGNPQQTLTSPTPERSDPFWVNPDCKVMILQLSARCDGMPSHIDGAEFRLIWMDIQPESHYGDPLKTVFLTSLNIYAAYTNAYTPGRSYVERDVRVPVMGKRFAIVATSHNAAIKNITVAVNVQNLWD